MIRIEDRIEATAAALLASVRDNDLTITGDHRVSESDAAALLAYAPKYLAQMRQEGRGPRCFKIGMNGSRISYRLSDLACWIENSGE